MSLSSSIVVCAPANMVFPAGDVAISSASFILVSSQLRSLLTLIDLSRTVFNRVKFNFVRAFSSISNNAQELTVHAS